MLENAWNEYRAWAKRARDMQNQSQRWTRWAMAFAIAAVIFGALAGAAGLGSNWTGALAFIAAACAAATPVLGQDILSVGREAQWIRARVTAEAIKSECFRFAARAGDYAAPDAGAIFEARRDAAIAAATQAGLTPLADPDNADPRRPADPLDAQWYLRHRVGEQQTYYAKGQAENEKRASLLRNLALAASLLAATLGAASSSFETLTHYLTPWIGVFVTLGAMIVAYGLMERRQVLGASYGAMAHTLGRLAERYGGEAGGANLPGLVTLTEDLLAGEHAAWSDHMLKTSAAPVSVKPPELQQKAV